MEPNCLDENALSELASGTLADEPLAASLGHLERCAECRFVLAELVQPERLRAPSWELPVGERLGRYLVLKRLGVGGMGTVYSVYDPALGRKVALKILHARAAEQTTAGAEAAEAEDQSRLLREAQAMARLEHPNVLAVHDVGAYGGHVYLSMDLVEGESLRAFLQAEERPLATILAAFRAAGAGLVAAHQAGLVHCDFKPDNVLRSRDGRILVMDFGLAEVLAEVLDSAEKPADAPRESRPLHGSLPYVSPERLRGEAATSRCDAWSFCVALYEAIYDQRPFSGPTRSEQLAAILRGLAPPPSRTVSGRKVPGWLRKLLVRGLSRQPKERFASMAALLFALDRKQARRLHRWSIFLLASVFVFCGIATFRWLKLAPLRSCEHDLLRAQKILAGANDQAGLAADGYPRLMQVLTAYQRSWFGAAQTSCQDTFLRRTQSHATQVLRARCFSRQLDELAAIIEVLAQPIPAQPQTTDPGALAKAFMRAAAALPSPDHCSAKQVLSARTPPSAAGCAQGSCEQARRLLAKVRVEKRLLLPASHEAERGRIATQLDEALGLAARAGDEALTAEAQLEKGLFLRTQPAHAAQGLVILKQALWASERARDDTLTARAWVAFMIALSTDTQPAEAQQLRLLFPHARAAVLRVGGDAELSAALDKIAPDSSDR